jgi:hypothetical protein
MTQKWWFFIKIEVNKSEYKNHGRIKKWWKMIEKWKD